MRDFGILGAGWISRKVYIDYILQRFPLSNIYIFDPLLNKDELGHPRLHLVYNVAEILQNPDIMWLIIASPNKFHYEQLVEAVNNGKMVLCEKPFCMTYSEAVLLQQLYQVKRNQIYFSVPCRYREDIQCLKNDIHNLGKIYRVNAKWIRAAGIPGGSPWHLKMNQAGGGALIDLGPHLLDIVFWLLSPTVNEILSVNLASCFMSIREKYASWHNSLIDDNGVSKSDVEDNAVMCLKLDDAFCMFELAWASSLPQDTVEFEIFGLDGYIKLTSIFGFSDATALKEGLLEYRFLTKSGIKNFSIEDRLKPYHMMLDDYIDNPNHKTDFTQSINAMQIITSAYVNNQISPLSKSGDCCGDIAISI